MTHPLSPAQIAAAVAWEDAQNSQHVSSGIAACGLLCSAFPDDEAIVLCASRLLVLAVCEGGDPDGEASCQMAQALADRGYEFPGG